jgi:SAM-dependent methyltransferase
VTGVDIDPDAIANIDVRYRLPNTTYQPMDCQAMTFGDASFDVIVSNALLEYLTDCDAFFDEVMRVLRPGGTFICGTKNADLSIKARDGSPLYPDHLREFSPEQLRSAIATRLAEVQVFSQVMASKSEAFIMDPRALFIERWLVRLNAKHIIPIQWRNSVRRWITGIDRYAIGPDDFEITAQDQFHDAFYLVAVSKRA